MRRDLEALQSTAFDVVVIGGGIYGACAAWDAAQRGLSVALVERGDFGASTSANSYKIVHGGIRYVQHGDVPRVRSSSAERRMFLKNAPHLVRPLPIVVPTYGRGMKGRMALRLGMGLYDGLTLDRNRGIADDARKIPPGRMISRAEVLDLFPGLDARGLTGAAIFADAQMYNPPRLVLAAVKSATEAGAVVANHLEATGLVREGSRVGGIEVKDRLSGDTFAVAGRVVLNAAGPYGEVFLRRAMGLELKPPGTYSRDACFLVPGHRLHPELTLAVQGQTSDPDAIVSRGNRHLFVAPWRRYTLVGTWHKVVPAGPDEPTVTDRELEAFVDEVNAGYPDLALTADDISVYNCGLVPFGENREGAENLRYGHRSRLVDHAADGLPNLISLIGVRFTTGRREAEKAVDLAFRKLGHEGPGGRTSVTPMSGGDMDSWTAFRVSLERSSGLRLPDSVWDCLAHNHGTDATRVLAAAEGDADLLRPVGASDTIRAQVRHAVREEMAMTLADVLFRRTDLATGEFPGHGAVEECMEIVAGELGLGADEQRRQIQEVERRFRPAEIRRAQAVAAAEV